MRAELLNNPIWHSLNSDHSAVGAGHGPARIYDAEVLPFAALSEASSEADCALLGLAESGLSVGILAVLPTEFAGWEVVRELDVSQYVWPGGRVFSAETDDVVRLGMDDVPEMLDLTSRVYPAFFRKGTAELGAYFGIRTNGRLVAMAGIRMSFEGFREISAVCVDAEHRGRGFGLRVTERVIQEIESGGNRVFLHTESYNAPAKALYEKMGFQFNQDLPFRVLKRL